MLDVGGGADEMIYLEYIEAWGAVTCYKKVNPYIPLHVRMEELFVDRVFVEQKRFAQQERKTKKVTFWVILRTSYFVHIYDPHTILFQFCSSLAILLTTSVAFLKSRPLFFSSSSAASFALRPASFTARASSSLDLLYSGHPLHFL